MSEETNTTEEIGEVPGSEATVGNEQPKESAIDPSSIYPTESFVPYIEGTFDAMIKDFNHFKNNAKTEDVKALYLKAIMSLTKSKNEVLSAVNADTETRK
jgi:hypothetical protein